MNRVAACGIVMPSLRRVMEQTRGFDSLTTLTGGHTSPQHGKETDPGGDAAVAAPSLLTNTYSHSEYLLFWTQVIFALSPGLAARFELASGRTAGLAAHPRS